MKLEDILIEREGDLEGPFSRNKQHMNDEEFAVLVDIVDKGEMNKSEIIDAAVDLAGSSKYLRTAGAAKLSLARIHAVIHGILPHGVESTIEDFYAPSGRMVDYLSRQGYDVQAQLRKAKDDMQQRIATRQSRLSSEQAREIMAAFYNKNKKSISPSVRKNRDSILAQLMSGEDVESVFAPYMLG